MYNVTYYKVSTVFLWVGSADPVNKSSSQNEPDEGVGSHVTYKIFSLMLGIFRPSAALEAAVRLEASVRNSICSQVSVLSSCHFPLTESRGTVFYLTSIKTWALTRSPRPSPPRRAPPVYHH